MAGRPTDFKEEYCTDLIHHMSVGKSFESFAGTIGVCRATIYNWCEQYPLFLDAKKIGVEMALDYWENLGQDLVKGKINGNATVWIFTMKNRFKELYRERQEIEHSGNGLSPVKFVLDDGKRD